MRINSNRVLLVLLIISIILIFLSILLNKSHKNIFEGMMNDSHKSSNPAKHNERMRNICKMSVDTRKDMQTNLKKLNDEFDLNLSIMEYEEVSLDNMNERELIDYNDIEMERISELGSQIRKINHAAAQIKFLKGSSHE